MSAILATQVGRMEKMLIFVADLTNSSLLPDPVLTSPSPSPPVLFRPPARPLWWPSCGITALLHNEISNTRLCSTRIHRRTNGRQGGNEEGGECIYAYVLRGGRREDARRRWFINNAKCLNIGNSSGFPKSDDKTSVTRCVAPDAPVLLCMNEIAGALL